MHIHKTAVKKKDGKISHYLRLVQSYRKSNGKVDHKIIANLGRSDLLLAFMPQIQKALGLSTNEESQIGNCKPYVWGPILVAREIWNELKIGRSIQYALAKDKAKKVPKDFIDRVFALVASRFVRPTSEHNLASVLSKAYVVKTGGDRWKPAWINNGIVDENSSNRIRVNQTELMRWYRTLDILYKHKNSIEQAIFDSNKDLFTQSLELVLYDITSSYFEGRGPEELAKHGHSRDHRSDKAQIVIGLLLMSGLPVAHHIFAGNTADKTTVKQIVEDASKRFNLDSVIFVMDCGMLSEGNMEFIVQSNQHFIVSIARRRKKIIRELLEEGKKETAKWIPLNESTKVCEITTIADKSRRYFIVSSVERKKFEESIRQGCVKWGQKHLEELKVQVTSGGLKDPSKIAYRVGRLSTKYRLARYFSWKISKGKFEYFLDKEKLKMEESIEGNYFLMTSNKTITEQQVASSYKSLWEIEASFRQIKSTLEVRPIYHKTKNRVCAHVFVSVLSFIVEKRMHQLLNRRGIKLDPATVFEMLNEYNLVEMEINGKTLRVPSNDQSGASRILAALNIYDRRPDETVLK